jgi:hypothetical protein
MLDVWEEAGILPMAIRLRRSGRCPSDIDDLYGTIMDGIVWMAAGTLVKDDPRYMMHKQEFMSPDCHSSMLLQVLSVADRLVDTDQAPRNVVNYLVKTVQNRLRNWVRDRERRRARLNIESESVLDGSPRLVTVCSRIDGQRIFTNFTHNNKRGTNG